MSEDFIYKENIFTKIINKEIKSEIIYENEKFLVIKDIHPKAPVHFLLLPKTNYVNFIDFLQKASVDEKSIMELIILKIFKDFKLDNGKVVTNYGSEAGQEIMHFHIHLMSY
jgi:histidine triad (HIT) family protein